MKRHYARYLKDEEAVSTVELVIWMPIFVLMLGLVLDASLTMLAHARIWDVARDTTRQVSIGKLTASEAISHAASEGKVRGVTPTVTANDSFPEVWVDITLPIEDVALFNILGYSASDSINARVTMMQEPT